MSVSTQRGKLNFVSFSRSQLFSDFITTSPWLSESFTNIWCKKQKKTLLKRVVEKKAMKELAVLRETQVDTSSVTHAYWYTLRDECSSAIRGFQRWGGQYCMWSYLYNVIEPLLSFVLYCFIVIILLEMKFKTLYILIHENFL